MHSATLLTDRAGREAARRERAQLAKKLIADSCERHNINKGELTVHADRGLSIQPRQWRFSCLTCVLRNHISGLASRMTIRFRSPFQNARVSTRFLRAAYAAHPERFPRGPSLGWPIARRCLDQSTQNTIRITKFYSVNYDTRCLIHVDRFRIRRNS